MSNVTPHQITSGNHENQENHGSDNFGNIVESEWVKSPDIRPDMNLELGVFVVMPNHFHGIVTIGKNEYNRRDGGGSHGNPFLMTILFVIINHLI